MLLIGSQNDVLSTHSICAFQYLNSQMSELGKISNNDVLAPIRRTMSMPNYKHVTNNLDCMRWNSATRESTLPFLRLEPPSDQANQLNILFNTNTCKIQNWLTWPSLKSRFVRIIKTVMKLSSENHLHMSAGIAFEESSQTIRVCPCDLVTVLFN